MQLPRIHIQASHAVKALCGNKIALEQPNLLITIDEITNENRDRICKACLAFSRIKYAAKPCQHLNAFIHRYSVHTIAIKEGQFLNRSSHKRGDIIFLCSACGFQRVYRPDQQIPQYLQHYLKQNPEVKGVPYP